jgi:hypothetical protein
MGIRAQPWFDSAFSPANFLFFTRFPVILLRSDSQFTIQHRDYD